MKMIILFVLLISFMINPIFANSSQTKWQGIHSSGSIVLDEECPLIVEKELLTFDIQEFPQPYYNDIHDFLDYNGKVTAQYTFYNPKDYKVNATLVFPFGTNADYGEFYDEHKRIINIDTHKYDILLNDQIIDKQLRHTFMLRYNQFDYEQDISKLNDDFINDNFYHPELKVTRYAFVAENVNIHHHRGATAGLVIDNSSHRKIYQENNNGAIKIDNDYLLISSVDLNKEFYIYVIGEPLNNEMNWGFYHDGYCQDKIPGEMKLLSTQTMTFKDFALSKYHRDSKILEHDWYNAFVLMLKHYEISNIPFFSDSVDLDLSDQLMRWYQYDIVVDAKERAVNTVSAPIYPSIDSNYDPSYYEYTYLLTPANSWKEFTNLDIIINTPYYIIDSNLEGFERIDDSYQLHLDKLPNVDLIYTLSLKGHSYYVKKDLFEVFKYLSMIIIVLCVIIVLKKILRRKKYEK